MSTSRHPWTSWIRAAAATMSGLLLASCIGEPVCVEPISFLDGQSASVSSDLDVPVYETAERVDILIDWSALDQDMFCAPMDPVADVERAWLMSSETTTQASLTEKLVDGSLAQPDFNYILSCEPEEETSCWLSELGLVGNNVDPSSYYVAGDIAYLLALDDALTPDDTHTPHRSFAFLVPLPESIVTEVHLEPTCPMASITVDLQGSDAIAVQTDGAGQPGTDLGECIVSASPSWPLDWSALTVSASGTPLDPSSVDLLVVSRYDLSLAELEASFADRDALAAESYTLDLHDQTSADLANAKAGRFDGLEGFSGSGIWLLELRESSSLLPVPAFLAVVEPRG